MSRSLILFVYQLVSAAVFVANVMVERGTDSKHRDVISNYLRRGSGALDYHASTRYCVDYSTGGAEPPSRWLVMWFDWFQLVSVSNEGHPENNQ